MSPWRLHLAIDNEDLLRTKLYDKRDFYFPIVNFPFICSNIRIARADDPISQSLRFLSGLGPGWLNELDSWITQQLEQAYHQYGVGSRPAFVNYKKAHSTRSRKW